MANQKLKECLDSKYAGAVWVDEDENLHFSVPDMLRYLNVKDTPENRAQCIKAIKQGMAKDAPDTAVTVVQEQCPSCFSDDLHEPWCPLGLRKKPIGNGN